jgi:flagellar biosynthesis component FlhA/Tfp pilus assembly protein PilF
LTLRELVTEAGMDAVLGSAEARATIEALEREFADADVDPRAQRRALLSRIGELDAPALRAALGTLVERFDARQRETLHRAIDAACARSPEEGAAAWLGALAEHLGAMRLGEAETHCAHPPPGAATQRVPLEALVRTVARMRQQRWEDVYPNLEWLADQPGVSDSARARLTMMLGQIQHFCYGDRSAAMPLLERASGLAPRDGVIQSALGDPWLDVPDRGKAERCFDRAIEVDPRVPQGYVGRGDAALRADPPAVDEAEGWFRKAVTAAPGESLGYQRLQTLYARPERISRDGARSRDALERRIAVEPGEAGEAWLDAAVSHQAAGEYELAAECYDRAITLHPNGLRAYLYLAELRRVMGDGESALAACRHAIEVAPDSCEGYLALANVNAALGNGNVALQVYADMPLPVRETGSFLRKGNGYHNCLGDLHYSLDQYAEAEREYLLAIERTPGEPLYWWNLGFARQQQGDYARAEEAFVRAAQLDQDTPRLQKQRAVLANERANHEYSAGRYAESVGLYRQALELNDREVVFHTNLAGAWEKLAAAGGGAEALDAAIGAFESAERVSQRKDWSEKLRRLRIRRDVARACGDAVLARLPVATPIVVEIAADLVPLVKGDAEETLADSVLRMVEDLRSGIAGEFGVTLPGIRFRGNAGDLPAGSFVISLHEVPLLLGTVVVDRQFVAGPGEVLERIGTAGQPGVDPLTGRTGAWVEAGVLEGLRAAAPPVEAFPPMGVVLRQVESLLRRNLGDFLGHQEVATLLANSGDANAALIRKSPAWLTDLVLVCRALLHEGVPLVPWPVLCSTFASAKASGYSPREIAEQVRSQSGFRERLPGNEPHAGRRRLELASALEARLAASLHARAASVVLALAPDFCQQVLAAVRATVDARPAVLVVREARLRPFLRRLVELEFPMLPVLSLAEVLADSDTPAEVIEIEAESVERDPIAPAPTIAQSVDPHVAEAGDGAGGELLPDVAVVTAPEFPDSGSAADTYALEPWLALVQDEIFQELGLLLPTVRCEPDDPRLASAEFRVRIHGVELGPRTGLDPKEFLAGDSPDRLRLLGLEEARRCPNPASGAEHSVLRLSESALETCRSAGVSTWGPVGFLALALSAELRKSAARLQTDAMVAFLLESLRDSHPSLVEQALERYPLPRLGGVLRALLQEEVSVRDLRGILEGLLAVDGTTDADSSRFILFSAACDNLYPSAVAAAPADLTNEQLADAVRVSRHRYLSHKHTRGQSSLLVLLIDPAIEQRIIASGAQPLTLDERERLWSAVETEYKGAHAANLTILTDLQVRRALRTLLRPRFPGLPVLAYQELSSTLNIQPIARISL